MPELPEVETTRRGIAPHVLGRRVVEVIVRQPRLRWPIPESLAGDLKGQPIEDVGRRGKYLLLHTGKGTAILHLGMSGSLRIVDADLAPRPHDHVDIRLDSGRALRLHDPRRFGALLWTRDDPLAHELLRELGPEPLGEDFDGDVLHAGLRARRCAIKLAIMDSHVVVGVGNIYASEALFRARIHPRRCAGALSRPACRRLAEVIREVLSEAVAQGGTTLRDFVKEDGEPGYFAQHLNVYDRAGLPCPACGKPVTRAVIGQRSSFYCTHCQR
ncbi:MAG: bifunctional DNA-formamidopyrimidine glycosylase/DNA-(apurinic or apyrimidinic site) lyase [Chromatiales bacterium]|jgi:formamidopyrimidine-DNA glycosylase|nr:bifunctional DNA-formamidopyrimidine glycosylase/DNA-(apurinic or apyrimidinic site) lyase [Chromatiales bacterium]MDX9766697.1 bifunctional DNA-formamidopyrimidine glycosylase/DNA-(apurinic or apyrimidinic site) lyase [Ectothiorhodospiraceae bacterium]